STEPASPTSSTEIISAEKGTLSPLVIWKSRQSEASRIIFFPPAFLLPAQNPSPPESADRHWRNGHTPLRRVSATPSSRARRCPHFKHSRRRRMVAPSREPRESITLSS